MGTDVDVLRWPTKSVVRLYSNRRLL